MANLFNVHPFFFVSILSDWFLQEALPQCEQLNYIFSSLFKADQPIDIPGIKSQSIVPVKD